MNTSKKGSKFENRVFRLLSNLLADGKLPVSRSYSKIFQHKQYPCIGQKRKIDFDITIETYNPLSKDEEWSSLLVIECKNYANKVDISDLDEFETKIKKVSPAGIKGMMITTKGFSRNEIEQARKAHISLVVLSENQMQWLVSRDVNKAEDLMQVLLGYHEAGLIPVVYSDNVFTSLPEYLNSINISIDENSIVSIPWMDRTFINNEAKILSDSCMLSDNYSVEDLIADRFPEYRIVYTKFSKGILGALSFSNMTFSLSNVLFFDEYRRNFTLAHELGHLCLHRKYLEGKDYELMECDDRAAVLLSGGIVKRMEIQADIFASCLLMPSVLFLKEVDVLFRKYYINKGYLYLDNQSCNQREVNEILDQLSTRFKVSKEAVKIRMIDEGLFLDRSSGPKRLFSLCHKLRAERFVL